jgi:beta-lactamase regulating signal transducer with metallopeptidase domain/lysophospholipase L1-like esterase
VNAETILLTLARINLVASVAILLVLLLRPFVLRWLGASVVYWLWLVVPIASVAGALPAHERVVLAWRPADVAAARAMIDPVAEQRSTTQASTQVAAPQPIPLPSLADTLLVAWLIGAGALLTRSIVNTRRLAADPSIGPALVGVLRPRLVLPADFETRFDAQERALILAHEETHRVSGHTLVNALVEAVRCLSWFNPLAHLAASRIRTDQELACDAAVIATHPGERRAYANALLKTQIGPAFLPLGCTWTSRSANRLRERIEMLGRTSSRRWHAVTGAAAVGLVGFSLGYAAWAQQPERVVTQIAAADAPMGLLSPLERMRHERAVKQAQAGNIDVVFFGDSDMEFWFWKERGLSVWQRELGSFRADNFGSQGAHTRSILWRMQNGELDGYDAKLVVLNVLGIGDLGRGFDVEKSVANHKELVAEIRKRQPRARILLFANFRAASSAAIAPRLAAVNAGVSRLADNENVFFVDINDRLREPGGYLNSDMWSIGMRPPGYAVWGEELRPWLARFGR